MRDKFTSDVIYSLKLLTNDELDVEVRKILNDEEYKLYKLYRDISEKFSIDGFVDYITELMDLNNPEVVIYVGDKNQNFDSLSKYIKTIYSSEIYKGVKIKYRNRIYDYSLNERNV